MLRLPWFGPIDGAGFVPQPLAGGRDPACFSSRTVNRFPRMLQGDRFVLLRQYSGYSRRDALSSFFNLIRRLTERVRHSGVSIRRLATM